MSSSIAEIKKSYYGTNGNGKPEKREPKKKALTGSANYILRETRRFIGQTDITSDNRLLSEKQLFELVNTIENREQESLSEIERTMVVAALSSSLENYDILTPLIENPDINDIIIKSFDDISVQKGRSNFQTDLSFPDHSTYQSFVENLLKRAGKSSTTATPVVDATIDSRVRACVTHESFSPKDSGPMLTLRIARHKNISLPSLAHSGLAPSVVLDYLKTIVAHGNRTILVAGEVGTGKTTLVKALASNIPESEAILIIEDTHELNIERRFVRTLLTRENNTEGSGKIAPATAIRTGMRMAMNRVILGEMRDAEAAEAFVDVCASGHPGLSTIHARSARDSINRLEIFLLRAQANVDVATVRRQISDALSVVVFIGLDPACRTRRIMEVVEVGKAVDGAVQFSPIFSFNIDNNSLQHKKQPTWLRQSGVSDFDQLVRNYSEPLPLPGQPIYLPLGLEEEHD